ncbi:hypothetical protein RIF29_14913 [Crotalaria pallida]|uniref:Uncharacterized protein n=1 Tax=Crotalaria pallida TaxID=3830 RepID=A0AAN9ID56_CROPI
MYVPGGAYNINFAFLTSSLFLLCTSNKLVRSLVNGPNRFLEDLQDDDHYQQFCIKGVFRPLAESHIQHFAKDVNDMEIHRVVFEMGGLKAQSIEGLHKLLYKS